MLPRYEGLFVESMYATQIKGYLCGISVCYPDRRVSFWSRRDKVINHETNVYRSDYERNERCGLGIKSKLLRLNLLSHGRATKHSLFMACIPKQARKMCTSEKVTCTSAWIQQTGLACCDSYHVHLHYWKLLMSRWCSG